MEGKKHNVLILAGTNDQMGAESLRFFTNHWKNHGIDITVYNMGWKDGSKEFEPKLAAIEKLVEELAAKGPVSIIGCSAGASAAFNLLLKRPDVVQKAIGICGRIRGAKTDWGANLKSRTFHQSVLLFEEQQDKISEELKKRMMTISARFGDGLVPKGTSHVEGATNITIPMGGHGVSIRAAVTLFKKPLVDFIKLSPEK